MEFVFPILFSELKERHGNSYRVSAKNPLLGLDDRLKEIKISQFDSAFQIDPTIITQQEYFDLVYYLIDCLQQVYEMNFHAQIIQILHFQLQQLVKNQAEPNSFNATLFFFLVALSIQPQRQQDLQKARQQLSSLQVSTYKKSLKFLVYILLTQQLPKDSSRYFFDLVQLFIDLKDPECRDQLIQIMVHSIGIWKDNIHYLKNKIINLVYESENIVSPISSFLVEAQKQDSAFVFDLITLLVNYISQKTNQQTESQAVKNLKEILSQTCRKTPKLYYTNLSTFIELYDNENYHLRNALTDILQFVIEHLTNNHERDDEEQHLKARNKLIETLFTRQYDKVTFARTQVLSSFSYLLGKNCIPKEYLKQILDLARTRIRDISGWVRKAALQLMKKIVKYYTLLYVQSQEQRIFYTSAEVDQIFNANQTKIAKIAKVIIILFIFSKEFHEIEQQIEQQGLEPMQFTGEIEELKRQSNILLKAQIELQNYKQFIDCVKSVLPQVSSLLMSKNQMDALGAIKLFAYLKKTEFEGNFVGIKRIITLVWHDDKTIVTEVTKQFSKLYLKFSARQQAENLMNLIRQFTLKEIVCFEKLISLLKADVKSNFIDYLNQSQEAFIILRIACSCKLAIISGIQLKNLQIKLESYKSEIIDWIIFKEICQVIEIVKPDQLKQFINTATYILYKTFGGQSKFWYQGAEAVIGLICAANCPEIYYEFLLKKFLVKMINENVKVEPVEEIEDIIEEEELKYDPRLKGTYLCQFIFCLGHVALKLLVHIDSLHSYIKNARTSFEKNNKDLNKSHDELEKMLGGVEAEQERLHELINNIAETQIVQQNFISQFMPLLNQVINQVVKKATCEIEIQIEPLSSTLDKVTILTLCKFMCLSESFCKIHLQTLFIIMKSKSIDKVIKNNIIITIGDLLHRWPNTVELFHRQIFANLYDANYGIRKITLLVLTHLILNDMIKSRTSLVHIPKLLVDPDQSIPPMARYFLSELQKKEPRCITNVIGDIIANVGKDGPQILPQILINQEKNSPDLVIGKLLKTLSRTNDTTEARNIVLSIVLLPTLITTMKILLDGWEDYRKQCEDPYIQDQFKNLVRKCRRQGNINQEMKILLDEFENRVDNYHVETFEQKKRAPKKSKAKDLAKQNPDNIELEQQQPQKKSKRTTKKKGRNREYIDEEMLIEVEQEAKKRQLRTRDKRITYIINSDNNEEEEIEENQSF